MDIALIVPFCSGSHQQWAESYQYYSTHNIKLFTLPGKYWKWRMEGGAIPLATSFLESSFSADLILTTDMLNLPLFISLTRPHTAHIPIAVYFHENQLAYPWSPQDQTNKNISPRYYAMINYNSALAADKVFFNSNYNKKSFLNQLPSFLERYPDLTSATDHTLAIDKKSELLPLGLELKKFDDYAPSTISYNDPPLILWNHRWSYDKNFNDFFYALRMLQQQGYNFELAILGASPGYTPPIFKKAYNTFKDRIVQFGYIKDFSTYARWLWQADLLPITSNQDFFGGSLMEALYCQCLPLLPHRLAYPENISPSTFSAYYYQKHSQLIEKLASFLEVRPPLSITYNFRKVAQQFEWEHRAPQYDRTLTKVKRQFQRSRE